MQNGSAQNGMETASTHSVKDLTPALPEVDPLSDGFEDISLDDGTAKTAAAKEADKVVAGFGDSAQPPKTAKRVLLFSGFVSHQQLMAVMAPPASRAASFLGGITTQRPHRVMMKGPGGQGCAEVAVTLLPPAQRGDEGHLTASSPTAAQVLVTAPGKLDESDADEDDGSPFSHVQKGVRPRRLFARVASAARTARGVAMEVLRGALEDDDGEAGQHRLRCALLNLSLPVELVVQQMLAEP